MCQLANIVQPCPAIVIWFWLRWCVPVPYQLYFLIRTVHRKRHAKIWHHSMVCHHNNPAYHTNWPCHRSNWTRPKVNRSIWNFKATVLVCKMYITLVPGAFTFYALRFAFAKHFLLLLVCFIFDLFILFVCLFTNSSVYLRHIAGDTIKGFMIQARMNDKPVGKFTVAKSARYAKPMNCLGGQGVSWHS